MIVGLIKCDNGIISINNNDISLEPMYKRAKQGIGYLAQEASVFRKLTVEEINQKNTSLIMRMQSS